MNFVVSERAMKIAPEDLFSANQIIHLRPVIGHDVFSRFVEVNRFVDEHYPNFDARGLQPSAFRLQPLASARFVEGLLSVGVASVVERLARGLYGWYLRRRATTWQSRDQVRLEPECLKLHTSSHRASILARFDRAMLDAQQSVDEDSRREVIVSGS
jgi:hypothetical protein